MEHSSAGKRDSNDSISTHHLDYISTHSALTFTSPYANSGWNGDNESQSENDFDLDEYFLESITEEYQKHIELIDR